MKIIYMAAIGVCLFSTQVNAEFCTTDQSGGKNCCYGERDGFHVCGPWSDCAVCKERGDFAIEAPVKERDVNLLKVEDVEKACKSPQEYDKKIGREAMDEFCKAARSH